MHKVAAFFLNGFGLSLAIYRKKDVRADILHNELFFIELFFTGINTITTWRGLFWKNLLLEERMHFCNCLIENFIIWVYSSAALLYILYCLITLFLVPIEFGRLSVRQYALYFHVQFFTKMEWSAVGVLLKSVEILFISTPQNLTIMSICCCHVREYMELLYKGISPIKNLHKHYFFLLLCIFSRKWRFFLTTKYKPLSSQCDKSNKVLEYQRKSCLLSGKKTFTVRAFKVLLLYM